MPANLNGFDNMLTMTSMKRGRPKKSSISSSIDRKQQRSFFDENSTKRLKIDDVRHK